ncbi:uncharacterized protein CIMG_03249 [Coccidioides immitis RS]|uniref:Uncharacterized protein n=1 Tax=Coccidioides immitis (strain RS) TaxID=246410 RepID=J3KAY2_COCIM|nr:uncharacterized protein CIMG_03249 [Coccidioides immitis RS]EAS32225.3 hypothetical protein CIMG_03249 [Coccidioides immitis RS]
MGEWAVLRSEVQSMRITISACMIIAHSGRESLITEPRENYRQIRHQYDVLACVLSKQGYGSAAVQVLTMTVQLARVAFLRTSHQGVEEQRRIAMKTRRLHQPLKDGIFIVCISIPASCKWNIHAQQGSRGDIFAVALL